MTRGRIGPDRRAAARVCMVLAIALAWSLDACTAADPQTAPLRIGSKGFTEQYILAELVAAALERHAGATVERRLGLGGTGVCHAALVAGEIDLYVEYTGTGLLDVLKQPPIRSPDGAYRAVARGYRAEFDLVWMPPLGFQNTYALAVRAGQAEDRGWKRIGDLREQSAGLHAAFTSEFIERPDGLPGLAAAYGLRFASVRDLDPGLAYGAARSGQVDVISAFSTDARIEEYGLVLLDDDRGFFPPYHAAVVIRAETLARWPLVGDVLNSLAGAISNDDMRHMNFEVDVRHHRPASVAASWLDRREPAPNGAAAPTPSAAPHRTWGALLRQRRAELAHKTVEHVRLTALAMAAALLIGVPCGVLLHFRSRFAGPVVALVEMIQTIPSLAMLAFLFALFNRLGALPATTALVLYALLPIVVNTMTGLARVPPESLEAAAGLGLTRWQTLRWVEIPVALPVIVAGIRTATVWTVGIATLSTFIGAGGLGDFIQRGLSRNDPYLTLLGAAPAALLAVALSLLIRAVEQLVARR